MLSSLFNWGGPGSDKLSRISQLSAEQADNWKVIHTGKNSKLHGTSKYPKKIKWEGERVMLGQIIWLNFSSFWGWTGWQLETNSHRYTLRITSSQKIVSRQKRYQIRHTCYIGETNMCWVQWDTQKFLTNKSDHYRNKSRITCNIKEPLKMY